MAWTFRLPAVCGLIASKVGNVVSGTYRWLASKISGKVRQASQSEEATSFKSFFNRFFDADPALRRVMAQHYIIQVNQILLPLFGYVALRNLSSRLALAMARRTMSTEEEAQAFANLIQTNIDCYVGMAWYLRIRGSAWLMGILPTMYDNPYIAGSIRGKGALVAPSNSFNRKSLVDGLALPIQYGLATRVVDNITHFLPRPAAIISRFYMRAILKACTITLHVLRNRGFTARQKLDVITLNHDATIGIGIIYEMLEMLILNLQYLIVNDQEFSGPLVEVMISNILMLIAVMHAHFHQGIKVEDDYVVITNSKSLPLRHKLVTVTWQLSRLLINITFECATLALRVTSAIYRSTWMTSFIKMMKRLEIDELANELQGSSNSFTPILHQILVPAPLRSLGNFYGSDEAQLHMKSLLTDLQQGSMILANHSGKVRVLYFTVNIPYAGTYFINLSALLAGSYYDLPPIFLETLGHLLKHCDIPTGIQDINRAFDSLATSQTPQPDQHPVSRYPALAVYAFLNLKPPILHDLTLLEEKFEDAEMVEKADVAVDALNNQDNAAQKAENTATVKRRLVASKTPSRIPAQAEVAQFGTTDKFTLQIYNTHFAERSCAKGAMRPSATNSAPSASELPGTASAAQIVDYFAFK